MASSSSSESMPAMLGATISPISSSSSSTSRGTRSPRRIDSAWPSPSSSDEFEKESGGLKPVPWKSEAKAASAFEPKSVFGNAELLPSASSSIPAMTNGLLGHCESLLAASCGLSESPSPSAFSLANCFWAASRAASWRRAREGPVLNGAGGGGRIGMGWLAELVET